MQSCSHTITLVMEISQPPQPIHCINGDVLAIPHTHTHAHAHAHAYAHVHTHSHAAMQSCSHRDFSVFAVYVATAAMEISQPRLYLMPMLYAYAVIEPLQLCSHRDFSVFVVYAVTAVMEMSQSYLYLCDREDFRYIAIK